MHVNLIALSDQSSQLFTADVLLMTSREGYQSFAVNQELSSCDERTSILSMKQGSALRYFVHQHVRYIWNQSNGKFETLCGLDVGTKCSSFHEDFKGLGVTEQWKKLDLYGPNEIDVEVKSYIVLLFEEVLNPFYIFQLFSVILWMCDDYYFYSGCIILISVVSIVMSLYETKKQRRILRDMVASHKSMVHVSRGNGVFEDLPMTQLVPGDVIVIPKHGCTMSCDAVLLVGNCIVNESMLTGESVPVTKTPLPNQPDSDEVFSPDDVHKRYTLFCGTQVIQTRYYGAGKVTAVVVRTGYSTSKGRLVRAILYPKQMDFKFYTDAIRFVQILFLIALCGMAYNLYVFIKRGESVRRIILRTLDIITIVVPVALPAAMTVGTIYAQNRLKKEGIFCISPPRINMCGKLNSICFDKTGTLTEDGLDLYGVVPVQEDRFLHVVQHPTDLPTGPFLAAMATCHSLTMIEGELKGDPLDLKMFESTNWLLEEPGQDTSRFDMMVPTIVKPCNKETYFSAYDQKMLPYEIGIVRQFVFTSDLQRMSVITRTLGSSHMDLYCKGSPEKVAHLCNVESLPCDFHYVLQRYTMKGFRVIAVAWKPLNPALTWHRASRIQRETVECELTFLGLIIMQNSLKPETTPVIRQLKAANIRVVMVTGDNMHTAISVARDCAMVDEEEKVIMVKASPPSKNSEAVIHWEYAEVNLDNELTVSHEERDKPYSTLNIESRVDNFHFAIDGGSFGVIRVHFPDILPKVII
ncbi:probable cation-transporting ATPase 13A3 [Lingula anatina]|uniref:Probable cation-transporting ATPase 13A3 n=1 Tax=Lingula anatina TaxID=7574 RepID=A0A1S3IYT1_LINAN|nr:probable cation-transporting ATPase 13A3 [Lingula anatina]|eukprot:XP_013403365.2 probable cation-transporting ATPase 13A3 [Lingula anatina]